MPERKKISDTCLLNRLGDGVEILHFQYPELLVDGEMKAYEEIFVRYYPTLCAYARMYVKREETAENIVQDLMLWLWENRTVLCISTSLPKYLFGAVRNNCLTYLGHESIERRVLGNIRNKMCEQFEVPDFDVVEELRENIRAAVAELPASYREAFEMSRFQRKTYEEIAAVLEVSPKTVDYRIQQCLKILRVKLKDYLPLLTMLLVVNE